MEDVDSENDAENGDAPNIFEEVFTINPNLTIGEMYMFVFKHEWVHDLKNRKLWLGYKKFLFGDSINFTDFCETHLLNDYGIEAKGQEAIQKLTEKYYENWHNSDEMTAEEIAAFDMEAAEEEMVCDFVAERQLGGIRKNGDFDQESFDALLELATRKRNIFQRLIDWIKNVIEKFKGDPVFTDMAEELEYLNERISRVYESKSESTKNNIIKYSVMNSDSYNSNVDKVIAMSDEEALKNYREGNFISIMKNTPEIILNEVKNAEDLEIIISFHSLYLETRHEGVLEGTYHNLGEKMKTLPELISNPDAIVRMNNGRINILTTLRTPKGNNGTISIELNTVKDINSKYDKYNLVITVFSSKDNYVRNNLLKYGDYVEYQKEDLPQVNPQLHKSLTIFNGKSSNNIIPRDAGNVNNNSSVPESHSVSIPFSEEAKAEKRKKYAESIVKKYGGSIDAVRVEAYLKEIAA